ncbi:MAG: phage tail tape measure protein, partial [Saprospiraceae bacterium]
AVAAALAVPIKRAADFETGMANIRKVVDGLSDPKALSAFGAEVRKLATELPIPIDQLQELVAAGGRMGIPRDQLIQYTREVAKMATAFDAAPGEIGEQMGKLATVYNIPIPEIGKLGDAINYLDDNAIAKGTDIIDVMRRVGGTAQQVGLGVNNVAALASTFLTLGSSAEVSATASNALIRELAIAEMQPKRFQTALQTLGIGAKDLQKNMTVNPQDTILGVLEKINALPKSEQIQVTTQLFGKEYGDDVARLAGGISEYRRQLGLLNDPKLSGSMQREFATRQQTLNARLQTFKNSANNAAIVFGTALLPALTRIMNALTPIIERLSRWMERNQKLVAAIGIALGAFAALSIAMSGIMFIVGGVARAIGTVSFVIQNMAEAVRFVSGNAAKFGRVAYAAMKMMGGVFVSVFNVIRGIIMTNPILAAITAIAIAAFLIYKNWDKIKPWLIKLWESVKAIFMKFWEWAKNFFLNYHPVGLIIKHWDKIKMIGTKFFEAGKNIMMSLWNGIKSLAQKPVDAILGVVKKMREYLPFSPAKVGPFKDLHKVKIVETIAQAIVPRPLTAAMGSVARAAADVLSPVGPSFAPATQGGGIVVNFQPNITWAGGVTEQNKGDLLAILRQYEGELVRMVESAMEKKARTKY